MIVVLGKVKGSFTPVVFGIDSSSSHNEHPGSLHVTLQGCVVQRCIAYLVLRIDGRSCLNELRDHIWQTSEGRHLYREGCQYHFCYEHLLQIQSAMRQAPHDRHGVSSAIENYWSRF